MRKRHGRRPFAARSRGRAGFTIVESMVAMVLGILVIGGTLAANIFGLRMFQRTETIVGATDEARSVIGKLREEIHSSTTIMVGKGDYQKFTEVEDNVPQVGTALQIYPGTNTNNFLIYYLDTDQVIKRWSSKEQRLSRLAHSVTNEDVFVAQDFSGATLSNNVNNRVIQITLQFGRSQNTNAAKYGTLNDFYQVQTKATRREVL